MKCSKCNGPMKPLFTGAYCPKDCDRPKEPMVRRGGYGSLTITTEDLLKAQQDMQAFIPAKQLWTFVPPIKHLPPLVPNPQPPTQSNFTAWTYFAAGHEPSVGDCIALTHRLLFPSQTIAAACAGPGTARYVEIDGVDLSTLPGGGPRYPKGTRYGTAHLVGKVLRVL